MSATHNIPEGFTFHPSLEEWKDPMKYIASIKKKAEITGIAKIVPPKGWEPPFNVDKRRFRFPTRKQSVHQLLSRDTSAAVKQFWDDFDAFSAENGTKLKKKPMAGGQEIDLYVLYRMVKKRGGYHAVSEEKGWKDIVAAMQISDKNGNVASTVKQHYQRLLEPYEIHCKSKNAGGANLLAAALDKKPLFDIEDPMDVLGEDGIGDDEAAEILEAMLGLAPAIEQMDPPKKKRKSTTKDSTDFKVPDNIFTMVCENCKGGHLEDKIILCDRCDKGWHMFCLAPPLESVPEGDWVCPSCIASEADMAAFRVGESYSLDDFELFGNNFEKQWFGNQEAARQASDATRESEYWRVVEKGDDIVEVLCGMGIDSTRAGSGFPISHSPGEENPAEESVSYVDHPWNLNNLPWSSQQQQQQHKDNPTKNGGGIASTEEHPNMLRCMDETHASCATTAPGVSATCINIGMLFSSFPWHVQDHLFYSVDYCHYGASRRWYSVPSFAAAPFEVAYQAVTTQAQSSKARKSVTAAGGFVDGDARADFDEQDAQDDGTKGAAPSMGIPFRPSSMAPPHKIHGYGVPVHQLTQEPGTFIVTFPNAYQCTVSLGTNFAEKANFAIPDWMRYGSKSASRYYCYRQRGIVCQQRMVVSAAQRAVGTTVAPTETANTKDESCTIKRKVEFSASASYWIHKELQRITEEEKVMRSKAWSEGLFRSRQIHQDVGMDPEDSEDPPCAICKQFLYLSAVECDCCPQRRVCLHHAANLCECSMKKRRLAWRLSLQELESLEKGVGGLYSNAVAKKIEKEENALREAEQKGVKKLLQLQGVSEDKKIAASSNTKERKEDSAQVANQQSAKSSRGASAAGRRPRGSAAAAIAVKNEPQERVHVKTEEVEDLEALAGFMTDMASTREKKRKRDDDRKATDDGDDDDDDDDDGGGKGAENASKKALTDNGAVVTLIEPSVTLPLTLVLSNGYVQGPVQPFKILDVYPEDREAAPEWLAALSKEGLIWADKARKALEIGGAHAEELSDLVEQAEQFAWGGAGVEVSNTVSTLQPQLAAAEDYMAAVQAALKGKPTLDMIDALLKQDPKPLANPPGIASLKEAVAAAIDWQQRVAKLYEPGDAPIELKALESAVHEASRLPVSLPEARILREQLSMARNIANAIRNAIPTAREAGRRKKEDAAITIEQLHALVNQAKASRIEMPEVSNLLSALENIEKWQEKAKDIMGSRTHLTDLNALLEEADTLPVILHETEQLRVNIEKAEQWLKQMSNMMRTRAPLKKLRDLLHAGYRLPVEIPEVDQLRMDIRRREWEDSTRRVVNTKGTLAGLADALAAAAEMGVEDSPLAIHLKAKLDQARDWDTAASDFLARFHGPGGCAEIDRPTIEQVAELVNEGTLTGVKMDRLAYLTQQLTSANKWLLKARQCLPPEEEAAEAGEEREAEMMQQYQQQHDGQPEDRQPEDSRRGHPIGGATAKPPKPVPAYDTIAALLAEYEDSLIIKATEANMLRTLRAMADRWLDEARPVLEQEYVVDEQLPLLNDLIQGGKATGVRMEQVEILEANVEALLWARQVKEILSKLPDLPQSKTDEDIIRASNVDHAEDADGKVVLLAVAENQEQEQKEGEEAADADGRSAGEEQQDGQPEQQQQSGQLVIPPPDSEPSDDEDDVRPIPSTPLDQRPPLPDLVHLAEEGSILPCDEELYTKFKNYVDAGLEWDKQARTVLLVSKEGFPLSTIDVRKLRKLITQGERLALGIPALPRLYELLRSHEKWEQRVRDLMATAGTRPAFSELQVFQDTARLNPISSNLRRHINLAVESVENWKEKCRRIIAKKNTGMRLDRCFDVLGHSVDCAVEQFERKLELEKRLVSSGPRSSRVENQEDEWELYCLCQQPYNVDTSMISCDACGEWYHIRCVGLTQSLARNIYKYSCPICSAVRNNFELLEQALSKIRKTLRPTRAELGDLLNEVKQMPVLMDEEMMLEKLLTKYDRWTTATYRAIEVHHLSRRKDNTGQILPLSDGMLHQLCKSALALEIDASQYAESILHLLRCDRWRARVDAVLDAGAASSGAHTGQASIGKASAEAVAKLLIEAERLEVDTKNDIAGARLLAAAEQAKQWKDAVRQCIADLKAAGGASEETFQKGLERAKELAIEADALPIRVERELEKLFEYAKPYCLCRRAYDEQIPMVECDSCGEWYHFECVGLPTPGSTENDTIPERFSCPTCCLKGAASYPYYSKMPAASIEALNEVSEKLKAEAAAAQQQQQAQQAQQAAAATAQLAGMYPQGWPSFATHLGRGIFATPGGVAPGGGAPALLPAGAAAMMNPHGIASMMEAYPHMMHPGMGYGAGFPALQQQQQDGPKEGEG